MAQGKLMAIDATFARRVRESGTVRTGYSGFGQKAKGRKNNGNKERTACGKGHEYVEGSWRLEKSGFRRCYICERANRKSLADNPLTIAARREKRRIEQARYRAKLKGDIPKNVTMADEDTLKSSRLNYLKMSGPKAEASDNLAYAIERNGRPLCESDPDKWTNYDERLPPTFAEAQAMCHGCPVLTECLMYAKIAKEDGMVLGGYAWVDGKPQLT